MSWKPHASRNSKQWRGSNQDYYNEPTCWNQRDSYNNQPQRSYNSHPNHQYRDNKNTSYENNRHYHYQYNQYNSYNRYNRRNKYKQSTQLQPNTTNEPWINKNSKNVEYCNNNRKFTIEEIPLNKLTNSLQRIWKKYYTKNVQSIKKIIFLCGPPGAGKTTICNYVQQYYEVQQEYHFSNSLNSDQCMMDVSDLVGIVMKENNGALIMSKVYELLLKHILQNIKQYKIFIIDGFLRKKQHVYVTHFLQLQMKSRFIFLVIDVDEITSVRRQLERGQKLLKLCNSDNGKINGHKKIRLKDSDLREYSARNRYRKYNNSLQSVRYQLQNHMKAKFNIIDATRPLKHVFECVKIQLRTQVHPLINAITDDNGNIVKCNGYNCNQLICLTCKNYTQCINEECHKDNSNYFCNECATILSYYGICKNCYIDSYIICKGCNEHFCIEYTNKPILMNTKNQWLLQCRFQECTNYAQYCVTCIQKNNLNIAPTRCQLHKI